MRRAVFGFYTYLEFFLMLLVFIPLIALSRVLNVRDPTMRRPGRWIRRLGRWSASLTPLWRFSVRGKAPADIARRPYVVVSNHLSTADPFLLSSLPWDMRWIAKEELFKKPFTGWAIHLAGDIRVRRGDGESVREMMDDARNTLRAGLSLMLFPEGTRSKDGVTLPFKDGAFSLAIEAGVPVLPVAVEGTQRCMPKHSVWFGDADATALILEPISTEGLGPNDVTALRERVRDRIVAGVESLRGASKPRESGETVSRSAA